MSEKKYIFKIDSSKAIEKFDAGEVFTGSDFKVTCENCLYDREIKLVENYRGYNSLDSALALLGGSYFTVVKNENVIDIVKHEDNGDVVFNIVRSNENNRDVIAYFSDKNGTSTSNSNSNEWCIINIIEDFKDLYNAISTSNICLLGDLTDIYIQDVAKYFTDSQLQTLIKHLTNEQLQILAEHLTDTQLEVLVDHLTNHQLQTFAQELNETKLKIIVPILNEDQLGFLVRGLHPEQLGDILPHLKTDQFKALIKNIDNYQLAELARDLADHHLSILSKELGYDQLQVLVHTLEEDKLKDLVNKLDDEKLEAIAQDLIEPSRVHIIIKSLANNPEKLQIFAHNMSDQQFAELLNNLNAEELKDIIHKLPYEKVAAVVGQSGDKTQLDTIVRVLEEKFGDHSAKQEEMMRILEQMKEDMPQIARNPDLAVVDSSNDSILFI
ncbi:magnesium transporter MgtE N-terminal domain-containing protein [Candidatus Wolbachia massiliensis]|uniref:MgtE intracellular N domain protein n=1 Tax=Candidatus Wolbachia massiliensis TaxID=1845000 RepID=A0A7M3U306_9RICK|nr:MgtE intracellular N domain protein [Candidatus Wolbachia massiliensis]QOD38791.1 MgtE intracellular N domain protein [Candidatus Wolbachia massiliensis]